jgi:site-specific DNA recombinase
MEGRVRSRRGVEVRPSITKPITAAIYCRVSSKTQEDGASLETQEERCRSYCDTHSYLVHSAHIYRDVQGGDTLERTALESLRDAIRSQRVQVVVAYAIDRLSRNQMQLGVLLYEAEQHDVRMDFVTEQLDDTPAGQFLRQALGFVARIEHEKIKERTQRGRRARALSGKLLTGAFPLYGYRWKDPEKGARTAYVPDDDGTPDCPANIVRRIFYEVANGANLRTVAKRLDIEGVPTPSRVLAASGLYRRRTLGTRWTTGTLHRMLAHPAYVGRHGAWRWQTGKRKEQDPFTGRVRSVREQTERQVENADYIPLPPEVCPALVDEQTVAAVRMRLEQNRQEAARHNSEPEAMLLRSGYIFCGHCQRSLYTHRVRGEWSYFCSSGLRTDGKHFCPGGGLSIQAKVIDPEVWSHVTRVLRHPQVIADAIAQWETEHSVAEDRATAHLAAVESQLRDLEAKAKNLTLAIGDAATGEARAVLTKALDDLSMRMRELAGESERLRAEASDRAEHADQVRSLAEWSTRVAERLDGFSYQQKRLALYALGVKVTAWRADHNPRYEVQFDFAGLNAGVPSALEPLTAGEGDESKITSTTT